MSTRWLSYRACSLVCLLTVHQVAAQSASAADLYQQGTALLKEGDYQAACPRLDQSFRQLPATATLLALAQCHEGQGKLLAAWSEYSDVAYRFGQEGQQAKADAARKNATALYPRLSQLTLKVSDRGREMHGLEVRCDGWVIDRAAWGTPLPVDAGQHRIEVSAPGREAWSTTVAIGPEGDRRTLDVPVFADAMAAPVNTAAAGKDTVEAHPAPRLSTLQGVGLATAGAGVVTVGLGAYFAVTAVNARNSSAAACSGNTCLDVASYQERQNAVRDGNRATAAWIVGGILVATGASLLIVGRPQRSPARARLIPQIGPREAGVVLLGNL